MTFKAEPSDVENRNFWLTAAALATVGFGLSLLISWKLFQRNVFFYQNNVFDADPDRYFRYVLGYPQMARRHPLMMLFVFPLSRIAELAQALFHLPFQTWAAIIYGPLAGAVKTILLMAAMRRIGLPLLWAALLALADGLCLSRLMVGSVPESFGPSSAAFALLFLLTACALKGDRFRVGLWIGCGVLFCGITITNIVPWALVMCCVLLQTGLPPRPAILKTIRISAAAALLVAVMYGGILLVFRPPAIWAAYTAILQRRQPTIPVQRDQKTDTVQYMRFDPQLVASLAPLANTYAFTGPLPDVVKGDTDPGFFPGQPIPRDDVLLPARWTSQWLLPVLLVHGLLILGLLGWFKETKWRRQLGIPALLIIAFQLALHCFWGGIELYLYVLHWQTALLFIIAGAWLCRGWMRSAAFGGLAALIVCEVVLNGRIVVFALHALDAQFVPR